MNAAYVMLSAAMQSSMLYAMLILNILADFDDDDGRDQTRKQNNKVNMHTHRESDYSLKNIKIVFTLNQDC